ncbi:glutamine synthetase family protein [Rubellimicrobium arenae]|uniref:glutamine synthetase family protein n=1 Tax=Rubellimicrobium arenae TaxID=2817372 RepID=UPI001B302313|nr:glutamine synthetase family protein [Rubellimicrobium arenae]
MIREPLVFAALTDIAGKLRGKGFPAAQLDTRQRSGIGWTPTNVQITCFDAIAPSPYGALGDLVLVPEPGSRATVDFQDGRPPEDMMLGDVRSLEGEPWECCTRSILRGALDRLERVAGLRVRGAFEQEFQLTGAAVPPGWAYSHAGFAAQAPFLGAVMAGLGQAGLTPDSIMKEYGDNQYEVTIAPEEGVRVADAATYVRMIVQQAALGLGERATFTPILDPKGVGNGVHIHLSFLDAEGRPATWDPDGPSGMSRQTGAFVAGILRHLGSIVAITAPSAISYLRLTPHRWSAAFNNLGFRDREASVRICPVAGDTPEAVARRYNFEFRAADATASPHLALAAILHAGAQGIEDGLPAPSATEEDLAELSPEDLARRGYERLPASLEEALDRFEADEVVRAWFPGRFSEVYLAHKRFEAAMMADKSIADRCAAYAGVY